MKKSSWRSQGIRSKPLQPRPLDAHTLGQAAGGEPPPPPSVWEPDQHNETLVRDRRARRGAS